MKKLFTSRSIFILLCALIVLNRFWPAWGPSYDNSRMIQWDSYGYYLYLPAFFIYDDPGMENRQWINDLQAKYTPTETFYQVKPGEGNKQSIKYPSGMAILWSPFFFIAHSIAEPLGFPADGLSPPYSWCIVLGGLIYAFIGLWFLRKVLLHFFNDGITAAVLVLITMGTNYWIIAASETVMPHSTLFALNAVTLWLIIRWHETRSWKHTVALALLMGVGILARPTQVFWLLVPLLWNVFSWASLKEKLKLIGAEAPKVLLFVLLLTGVLFLQLAYWKYSTGHWISYGYEERFSWTSPFFKECFFSFKKGWLVYTPLMIFAFAGFAFVWKYRRGIFWPLAVFVFVHTWVIMSWECWWYASSFSQRGAADMYAAMAIPLGYLVYHIAQTRKWYTIPVAALLAACVLLNLFQSWQYNHGIIHGERMSQAYYWRVFGQTSLEPEDALLLEPDHWPVPEIAPDDPSLVVTDDYLLTFEQGEAFTHPSIVDSVAHSGSSSYYIDATYPFGPLYTRNYHGCTDEYAWVVATVWIRLNELPKEGQSPPMLMLNFKARDRYLKYKAIPLDTHGLKAGEWRFLRVDMITPVSLYKDDEIGVVLWNPAGIPMYMDDFHVKVLESPERDQ